MLNTAWLLENDRAVYRRYQELYQRVNQLEREWVSVPFHWSEGQVSHVRSISEAYQALCEREVNWRLKQYSLFEHGEADYERNSARVYWSELTEWRQEATYARQLVQRVERGLKIYAEYRVQAAAEHQAYLERIGIS